VVGQRSARRKRIVVSICDQAVWNASNFTFSVLAIRWLRVAEFGRLMVVYAAVVICVGVVGALTREPLVMLYSTDAAPAIRAKARDAGAAALLAGLSLCIVGVAASSFLGPSRSIGLVAAVALPGLCLQDLTRGRAFCLGKPAIALRMDTAWFAIQVLIMLTLRHFELDSPASLLGAWGVAATLSLLVARDGRLLPTAIASRAKVWTGNTPHLKNLAAEYVGTAGAMQSVSWIVAIAATIEAVGALRATQVLFGPINMLAAGVLGFAVAEVRRISADGLTGRSSRLSSQIGMGLAASALLWMVLLLAFPVAAEALIGEAAVTVRPLILAIGLNRAAYGLSVGAVIRLRAGQDTRQSGLARSLTAGLTLAGATFGALLGGAEGAAWGLAIAAVAVTPVWLRPGLKPSRMEGERDGAS
jgi:hypothetical protein